ncbi:glycosyltransferase [Natronomonas gomsonensis]|uniref:glycosyltransferase n=1 Tax=Natronomonas gomsonensis TaxID=1046043 RepID=UPI00227B18EB|nr:glycosyltransferase [Natronomonas gomsonensis]MCY4732133.1 glycosyltransferase [Natronomonas gomsonensis]
MSDLISLFIGRLNIGGAERVAVNLSKGLSNRNYDVEIILLKKEGELLDDIPSDVSITSLEVSRARLAFKPLIKYLFNNRPETIISFMTQANIITAVSNKLAGSPATTILTEHTTLSKKHSITTKRDRLLGKYTYRLSDHIVGVSNGVANDVAQWSNISEDGIETIYNPTIPESFLNKNYNMPDHPWFRDNNTSVILSAGRHVPQKEYSTLIKSFSRLVTDHNVRLILLGDGRLTDDYKNLVKSLGIEDYVLMPGFIKDPYDYMSHADVFVVSSKLEGLSLVIIEALGTGTPVVSTDCPHGPREILDNGKYGKLVPIGDDKEMATEIVNVLNSSTDPEFLKSRASDFTIEAIVKKYVELIENRDL